MVCSGFRSLIMVGYLLLAALAVLAAGAIIYRIRKERVAKALVGKLVATAVAQVEHEAQMGQARGKEALSVRLVPQVPIRDGSANGWFGGGARLPAGLPWPEIDGAPLQLL